jgi:UDP-3-O-[3-hydroxymyristoyl] glucosamine N-acyltransferase
MPVSYSLSEIAAQLGGHVSGNSAVRISQVGTLEKAQSHQISFLANRKYRGQLETTSAGAVIVGVADEDATSLPRIVTNNPYAYFAKVSALFNPPLPVVTGVDPSAIISSTAQIDETASIAATAVIEDGAVIGAHSVVGAGCYVGKNVTLGSHVRLYPRVTIYHDCTIGNRLIAHSGVVIGADGFGIAMEEGCWIKVPQIGRVVIGNYVEIGANTTIDRGALDDTVIEDGVKLDNQIQIAHNVRIGAHTAIAGCVGIAGSTTIGRYCLIGGSAGILGHLQIADHVEISAFSLIGKSIREAGSYTAIYPFSKTEDWRANAVHLRHLEALVQRVKILEQTIASTREKP